MPADNAIVNTPRKHQYAFSAANGTTLVNRAALLSFGLRTAKNWAIAEGVTGLNHRRSEDYRADKRAPSGSLSLECRPDVMRWLMQLITGSTFASNVLKTSPPRYGFRVGNLDAIQAKWFQYIDCYVSKATFSSFDAMGSILTCQMDVEASDSDQQNANTWPVLSLTTQQPLVHSSSNIIINGVMTRVKDTQIVFDNMLMTDQFFNSPTRADFPSDGQGIQFIHTSPFDVATDLGLINSTADVAGQVVYTSPNMSVTFDFPCLKALVQEPGVEGRGSRVTNQITWDAVYAAGADYTTASICTITLDDTP